MPSHKKTKIIATIGPVSENYETIKEMILNGVNIFRLNFSHGSHEIHANRVKLIRQAEKDLEANVSILADLCGPKIRVGDMPNDVPVSSGDKVILVSTENYNNITNAEYPVIPISYQKLVEEVKPNEKIYIADGTISLIIESKESNYLVAKIINDGVIKSRKGVNFPESELSISAATEKDLNDLRFILTQSIDLVALSFVMRASDIEPLKKVFNEVKKSLPVIAKIEKPEAIKNIDSIIDTFDGIMIARGDLGIEVPIEKVPHYQREFIEKARQKAKPVIVATQMLESMIENPMPTRAEVSDIAAAIYDGTDAIMLSAETAVGKYPIEAVKMMVKICKEIEPLYRLKISETYSKCQTDAISKALKTIADTINISYIATTTMSGYTAQMISSKRLNIKIYAFSPNKKAVKYLNLFRGVYPYYLDFIDDLGELTENIKSVLLSHHMEEKGSSFILTCGFPLGKVKDTNLILIEKL